MSRLLRARLVTAGLLLTIVAARSAGQAPVINANVERRAQPPSIARAVQTIADQGAPAWIGYRVPAVTRADATIRSLDTRGRCRLEPPTELMVLARVDAKRIVEVRPVMVDCDVDAAGMRLVWFEMVNPDDSVGWLETLAAEAGGRSATRLADSALVALSQHASPAAAAVLVRLAREGATAHLRGQALVWLGRRAAAEALPTITAAIEQDPEIEVKRRAVLALSQMPRDEGIPRLIDLARTHRNLELRRLAFVYLGQSNDPRAIAFFSEVLLK
jgi:hypothetical protein